MRDYRKLEVWAKGHRLVRDIYRITQGFPRREWYGLTSQMRDAARGIPANIAEGAGRLSARDYARFVDMSCGSANELSYHIFLARDLGYLGAEPAADLEQRVAEIGRMAVSLRRVIRASVPPKQKRPAGKPTDRSAKRPNPRSDQQPATSDQRPATSDQRLATSD